jgi:hypothetical protein
MPYFFNIIGWGPRAPLPKHHCGSQQTLCLVPSLGCPTLVLMSPGWKKADEHLTSLMDQEHMITQEDT